MNLIEAIKSGKRFYRKNDGNRDDDGRDYLYIVGEDDERQIWISASKRLNEEASPYEGLNVSDLLDDWEIEESEVDKLKARIAELEEQLATSSYYPHPYPFKQKP